MATIFRRTWTSAGPTGKRVTHVAYGYHHIVNGKQERKVSSAWGTESEAMAALVARQQAIAAGQVEPVRAGDTTLGELVEQYLQHKGREGKRSLKDDTRICRTRLLPAFGATRRLRDLTKIDVGQYKTTRLGEVSAFTVSNELSVLRHMLRLARDEWGYLDTVPAIRLPKKPEGRLRYLETDEIDRLLDACRESRNRYLYTVVVLAVYTGMRKGEILGLEWDRVNLSSATITLYQTKSGKARGVPFTGAVYQALIALQPDPAQRHGRLFPAGNDRRGSQIRTAFEAALTRAGIKAFRFHDLRHTAASHLVMRGASLQEVKEILGHSDLRMTLRYAHLSPAHLRGAVERLDGLTKGTTQDVADAAPIAHRIAQRAIMTRSEARVSS